MAIVSRSFDSLRSYIGSLTWSPFVSVSRKTVLSLLGRIEIGQLVVKDIDGTVTICGAGAKDGAPTTELRVLKEAFWVRVMLFADMVGFFDPYRYGCCSPRKLSLLLPGLRRKLHAGRHFVPGSRLFFPGLLLQQSSRVVEAAPDCGRFSSSIAPNYRMPQPSRLQ